MKALVYGEIIWDVYPDTQVIGGAALNFAAHLAHMGAETYFISAVGEDELGEKAVTELLRHHVKTEFVQTTDRPTGACIVTLREGGLPSYHVVQNVAYDAMTADDNLISDIKKLQPDFFYFNTLSQRGEKSREALKKILSECEFEETVCDINLRTDCFDEDSLRRCMEKASIVKISDEEGHSLYDLGLVERPMDASDPADIHVFPQAVAKAFPNLKLVVYTLGGEGSVVWETTTGTLFESGHPRKVSVVSTVGAGDCYGSAFSFAYFSGKTVPECIAYAAEMSAQVVEHKDAVPMDMYE